MNPTIQVGNVTIELTKEQLAQIDKQRMVHPVDPMSVTSYPSVCEILKVSSNDNSIKVEVEGFSDEETAVVNALIKKMRICKVLNSGHRFKRGDDRWYSWYNVSSGFVFNDTGYADSGAGTGSASRLCFLDAKIANHFVKHFKDIDESIIDL